MRPSRTTSLTAAALGALLCLSAVPAVPAHAAATVELPGWLDSFKMGGDLRLRHDALLGTGGVGDRNRERFRARYGFTAVAQDITGILRLASGTGSQLSANQTEQSQFSQKGAWIDLAELRYQPVDALTLEGGRMNNPFWSSWESSLMWDPDLNPEGYAEEAKLPLGAFAKAGQFPINESASFADAGPWMFSEQLGIKAAVPGDAKATLAVEDNAFTNVDRHPLGALATNFGNTTAGGLLTSKFNVVHLWGSLQGTVMDLPAALRLGYVNNTRENTGHGRFGAIAGAELGDGSKAGTWQVAYYYKYLGANAVVANQVDDDFGPGGSNLAGHLVWAAYAPRDNVQLKLSFYDTRVIDNSLMTKTGLTSQRYTGHMMADILVKI